MRYSDKKLHKIADKKLLDEKSQYNPNFKERMSDRVAEFGGSWRFIIGFTVFFFGWIIFNLCVYSFDQYPFILLNLILSSIAVFQAPFILMSQNRMSYIDRMEQDNAYKINIVTELEIKNLHGKIDELIKLLDKKE